MSAIIQTNVINALKAIARSDVCQILDLIPSREAIPIGHDDADPSSPPTLCLGEYGDSEIYAFPDRTVQKLVVRDTRVRKKGEIREVLQSMGDGFKVVAPFSWSTTLKEGIRTPMTQPTNALVLMYMQLWAIQEGKTSVKIPVPEYDDLYAALPSIKRALDMEMIFPVSQRKISADVLEKYMNLTMECEKIDGFTADPKLSAHDSKNAKVASSEIGSTSQDPQVDDEQMDDHAIPRQDLDHEDQDASVQLKTPATIPTVPTVVSHPEYDDHMRALIKLLYGPNAR